MTMMRFLTIVTLGLMVLTVAAPAVQAQTVSKEFCVDNGSWDNDANWLLLPDGECGETTQPETDESAIIPSGLTCEVDGSGEGCGDITVESTAVVNVSADSSFQIRGPDLITSTITGTINLLGDGSAIRVNNGDHTFAGAGKIVGQHSGAAIALGGNVDLTNQTTIEGALAITEPENFDATFINQGTVDANVSGTLAILVDALEDSAAGVWKVTASGAILKFDIADTTADVLLGDFEVSNGTLDIDAPGFDTSGTLTFTGGTIDCVGLTVGQRAKFTGS